MGTYNSPPEPEEWEFEEAWIESGDLQRQDPFYDNELKVGPDTLDCINSCEEVMEAAIIACQTWAENHDWRGDPL
jgi:hypothetical protein